MDFEVREKVPDIFPDIFILMHISNPDINLEQIYKQGHIDGIDVPL